MVVILVPPVNKIFLRFFQIPNRLSSLTWDVYIGKILPWLLICSILLSEWRKGASLILLLLCTLNTLRTSCCILPIGTISDNSRSIWKHHHLRRNHLLRWLALMILTYVAPLCLRRDLLLLQRGIVVAFSIMLVQSNPRSRTVLHGMIFSFELLILILFIYVSLLLNNTMGNYRRLLLLRALGTVLPQYVAISISNCSLLILSDRSFRYYTPSIFFSNLWSSANLGCAFFTSSTISLLHLAAFTSIVVFISHIRLNPNRLLILFPPCSSCLRWQLWLLLLLLLFVRFERLLSCLDIGEHTSCIMSLSSEPLFLINSFLLHSRTLITRFWQPIGKIKEILRDSDGVEERALTFIKFIVRKKLFNAFPHNRHIQDPLTARAHWWVHLNERLHQVSQVCRINRGNLWVYTSQHFLIKPLHIISPKRRFESNGFV